MNIDEAVKVVCEQPTLIKALTRVAVWETERVVEQARKSCVFDTCFERCFTRVFEEWVQQCRGDMIDEPKDEDHNAKSWARQVQLLEIKVSELVIANTHLRERMADISKIAQKK